MNSEESRSSGVAPNYEGAHTYGREPSARELLQRTARQHRRDGNTMAAVAGIMGMTIGHVWSLLSVRTPELPPPVETENTVVKRITFNGGFSGGCRDVFISMPRIKSIDGAYKPSNDNNMATALTA